MADHSCLGGCGSQVSADRLACKGCWFRLPKWLRDAVNSAWRRRRANPSDLGPIAVHRAAKARAAEWYRDNPLEVSR